MRLLAAVLGILCLGSTTQAHVIHYSQHVAYTPARGQFPVQNGYLRYVADDGSERLVGLRYSEPLYGVRVDAPQPAIKSSIAGSEADIEKYTQRAEHFRAWCEQRYQGLLAEVERMRAEGQQPSAEMLAQIKPLETILQTSDTPNGIAESVDSQIAREEQLRIWNEARLKVLEQQAEQQRLQTEQAGESTKTLITERIGVEQTQQQPQQVEVVAETEEQRKAREEHMRQYNEAFARLQQIEAGLGYEAQKPAEVAAEAGHVKAVKLSAQQGEHQIVEQQQQQQQGVVQETPEVVRAKEEHLRLWNEAKLRAEQAAQRESEQTLEGIIVHNAELPISLKQAPSAVQLSNSETKIEPTKSFKDAAMPLNSQPLRPLEPQALNVIPGIQQPDSALTQSADILAPTVPAPPAPVQDTPEVQRAREEHLKLLREAQLQATQQSPQIQATQSTDDSKSSISTAEELQEAARLRAAEEKLRQEELLREQERLKEEQRLLEAERIRLQHEEERRLEAERLAEIKERQQEVTLIKASPLVAQSSIEPLQLQPTPVIQAAALTRDAFSVQEQYKQNPFLLRFAAPAGISAGNSAAVVEAQNPAQNANVGVYYLPDNNPNVNVVNPYFVRQLNVATSNAAASNVVLKSQAIAQQSQQQAQQSSHQQVEPAPIASEVQPQVKTSVETQEARLAEWERATREHFRAHEIALEQLRLANAKSIVNSEKNCQHN